MSLILTLWPHKSYCDSHMNWVGHGFRDGGDSWIPLYKLPPSMDDWLLPLATAYLPGIGDQSWLLNMALFFNTSSPLLDDRMIVMDIIHPAGKSDLFSLQWKATQDIDLFFPSHLPFLCQHHHLRTYRMPYLSLWYPICHCLRPMDPFYDKGWMWQWGFQQFYHVAHHSEAPSQI